MSHVIQAINGGRFDLLNPEASTFSIFEIANSLSHLCRFTGHLVAPYNVAHHSWLVSHVVPAEHALAGLLHDAAEAFMGDVATPLKALLPEYKALEERVETVVLSRFGLPPRLPPEIKAADLVLLATERRDLLTDAQRAGLEWAVLEGVEPLPEVIRPWPSHVARERFLERYHELTGQSIGVPAGTRLVGICRDGNEQRKTPHRPQAAWRYSR